MALIQLILSSWTTIGLGMYAYDLMMMPVASSDVILAQLHAGQQALKEASTAETTATETAFGATRRLCLMARARL